MAEPNGFPARGRGLDTLVTRRPWRVEYENAEGARRVERTFHTKLGAQLGRRRIRRENPGVVYEIRKHVEFEARS